MKWHRIKTLLIHSWYHSTQTMETWVDLVWFPIVSLLLFGFLSLIIGTIDPTTSKMLIIGYLLWEVVRVGQYCITVSVMWEVWSKSFGTLFVSPITLTEMMISFAIAGTVKTLSVALLIAVLGLVAFNVSLFSLGPVLLLYLSILLLFSFACGLFITGLILRYNTDIQSLAWGLIYVFQPISAVVYPVSILPVQIRWICYISPITYVMESARSQFSGHAILWQNMLWGGVLSIVYLAFSSWFIHTMFTWSKKTGALARLGN